MNGVSFGPEDNVSELHFWYDKVSANVMISVQKMGESESGQIGLILYFNILLIVYCLSVYYKVSANVMISLQKMGESGYMVF